MPGRVDHVVPRGQVQRQVHGRDEALAPPAAAQVSVGRGQEIRPRHGPEQAAERAGQQQRPGARVDALPGHIDQRHLQGLAVTVGHDEVAAERRAPGRPQHHVRAPAVAQRGQLALLADPVPQFDEHLITAQALQAELGPGPREDVREDGGHHDRRDDARARPVHGDVIRDDHRGDHEQDAQGPDPDQHAAREDRQDHHPRREPPLRQVRRGHANRDDRHREPEGHPPVPGDELPAQHRTQPLPAGPQAALGTLGTLRKTRGPGNHDGGTVSANPAYNLPARPRQPRLRLPGWAAKRTGLPPPGGVARAS